MDDPLATKIDDVISTLGLGEAQFRPLNERNANSVLQCIQDEFLTDPPPHRFWWERFREPQWSVQVQDQQGYQQLANLIPSQEEKYWLIASGTSRFLVYEGTIEAIQAVIGEGYRFEHYVVSQFYDWLLCENHHDNIIAVGSYMVEQLRKLHAGE